MDKQNRQSFPGTRPVQRSTQLLELVHSDICGPMRTPSIDRARYLLTIIDDYSQMVIGFLLKRKDQTFEYIKEYVSAAEAEMGQKVQDIRSDNGGEYRSNALQEYCKAQGIKQHFTPPYTSEKNRVAERVNRTLLKAA